MSGTEAAAPTVDGAADASGSDEQALAIHPVEATEAAARAVALVQARLEAGAAPADVAVLARVNSALLPVQVAFTEAGIVHTAALDASVLGRTGVRTALAYLRLGLDLERIRREDVLDTINRPARKVKSALQPHLRRSASWSIDQLETLADGLDSTHRDRFLDYLGDLRLLEAAITDGADTARCLWLVRNRIGLGEAMDALDASRTRPEGSSHGDDLDALEQLAALQTEPASFRDWLVARLRAPADPEGVTLSSVHRVKGQEWDHVMVVAATAGLFPHRLAEDVEEERRIFHVAVTRCRRSVAVIADRERITPFAAELTRASDRPTRESRTSAPPAPVETPRPSPAGGVVAEPGLTVTVAGGFTGVVVALDDEVAVIEADGLEAAASDDGPALAASDAPVTLRVPFGEPVTVAGQRTTLGPAPKTTTVAGADRLPVGANPAGSSDENPVDNTSAPRARGDDLYEALRSWRSRTAANANLPAYLVFHDRHLEVIAARKPASVRELAACPGVGPTKLERYGDDVLDVVETHA